MTMSRRLFAVDEQVTACSKNFRELNGNVYTIMSIVLLEKAKDFTTGEILGKQYGYYLDDDHTTPWCGSALRKHYPPADLSCDEIIDMLKQPIKEKIYGSGSKCCL